MNLNRFHRGHTAYIPYTLTLYMVYRPRDLYESDSSPCDINHQKDYTAWTSYDKNNFLLLFIDILFFDRV